EQATRQGSESGHRRGCLFESRSPHPPLGAIRAGPRLRRTQGRRDAAGIARNSLVFSAAWIARTQHISWPIIDKRASVPDDAGAAAGEALVTTTTAAPAEATPAKTADGLIEVRVTAIHYAARDANLYELAPVDGKPLPPYAPGAHIDLHLPNGLIRQYS